LLGKIKLHVTGPYYMQCPNLTEPGILTFMNPSENLNIIDTIISKRVQGLKQHYLIL